MTRLGTAPELTLRQLNRTTLMRQSLLERANEDVATAIGRLAGLQAQHANSPYIALWSRLAPFSIEDLQGALDARTVVKATVMRGTLHLVAAADYPAFSVASSVARIANWRPSADRVGVRTSDLQRRLLDFAHEPRTIAEIEANLEAIVPDASLVGKVPAGVRHVAFRMADAHGWLVHVPPSGRWESFAKPRYIDASLWLPDVTPPEPAQALRTAAERYLTAYGPASVADIGKWVGQPRLPAVREAITGLGDRIRRWRGTDGRDLVDLADAGVATGEELAPPRFLSRWDSVVIGYDRRERILPDAVAGDVVRSKNGDFLAAFTVDGFVAGTWATETGPAWATIVLTASIPIAADARQKLSEEAQRLIGFIAPKATRHEVRWAK
ncbi:MAG: winged helix DNA-binding domain-containing protein [Chloroflexota bacterium]